MGPGPGPTHGSHRMPTPSPTPPPQRPSPRGNRSWVRGSEGFQRKGLGSTIFQGQRKILHGVLGHGARVRPKTGSWVVVSKVPLISLFIGPQWCLGHHQLIQTHRGPCLHQLSSFSDVHNPLKGCFWFFGLNVKIEGRGQARSHSISLWESKVTPSNRGKKEGVEYWNSPILKGATVEPSVPKTDLVLCANGDFGLVSWFGD